MNPANPNLAPDFIHATVAEEEPGARLVEFPDGFRCYTHTSVEETEFIYNEVFVHQEYLRRGITLEGAASILDVGANIGMFALFAKFKNPQAVVHAFEPIPETFAILKRNVCLHGMAADVRVHPFAIGAHSSAQRTFTYYPNMAGNSTATPSLKKNQLDVMRRGLGDELTEFLFRPETRTAPVKSLSAFLSEEGTKSVDFLKIDVEGDEMEVLKGIWPEHYSTIRQIAVEAHSESLARDVRMLLGRMGFRVSAEGGMSTLPDVWDIYAENAG
jgi:FkbM family methyltransferase